MKRTFAILISAIMLFTALPFTASADVCEHTETEWQYSSYYKPAGAETDCTDPEQKISRVSVCKQCNTVVVGVEIIPVQQQHVLVELPMYDSEGKLVVDENGVANYTAPTCTNEGSVAYECTICKLVVRKSIPALGHNFTQTVVHVKCFDPENTSNQVSRSENGIYRHYCSNAGCDAYSEERITDHVHYANSSREPDCFEDGHTAFVYCINCASSSEVEVVPKLEHIDENNDLKCDLCLSDYRGDGVYCSCLCHNENAFVQLLMPLFKLIWQLLGIDNCYGTCESVHYVTE